METQSLLACTVLGSAMGTAYVTEMQAIFPLTAFTLAIRFFSSSSFPRATLRGMVFGLACSGTASYWAPQALQALGASHFGTGLVWVLLCIWTGGLPFAVLGAAVQGTMGCNRLVAVLGVGLAIYSTEWLSSNHAWGLPAILLGYLAREPIGIAQLAVVAGVPGLSMLLGMSCHVASWAGPRFERRRALAALVVGWVAVAHFGLPVAESIRVPAQHTAPKTLLFIQPNFDRTQRWIDSQQPTHLNRIAHYSAEQVQQQKARPDLILWPETTLTSPLDQRPRLRRTLVNWIDRMQIPLVAGFATGGQLEAPLTYRNSTLWIQPERGVIATVHKTRTIPVVESEAKSPALQELRALLWPSGPPPGVAPVAHAGSLQGSFDLAVLSCYEALFPKLAAARRTEEAIVFVNLSDDSWSEAEAPTQQLSRFASFRAIEQRLPFVRLAHGGLSVAYDEYGQELARLPMDRFASLSITSAGASTPSDRERIALLALLLVPGLFTWVVLLPIAHHFKWA